MGVWWSKTIQYRNRVQWSPLIPQADKRVCPEFWIKCMIRNIPAAPNEPLFLVWHKNKRLPLSAPQISRLLQSWCKSAKLDYKHLTSHCMRKGGLTWAHDADLTGEALMDIGDWKSQAHRAYMNVGLKSRIKSGKKMASYAEKL